MRDLKNLTGWRSSNNIVATKLLKSYPGWTAFLYASMLFAPTTCSKIGDFVAYQKALLFEYLPCGIRSRSIWKF